MKGNCSFGGPKLISIIIPILPFAWLQAEHSDNIAWFATPFGTDPTTTRSNESANVIICRRVFAWIRRPVQSTP